MADLVKQLQRMRKAQAKLAVLTVSKRNKILKDLAASLAKNQKSILQANLRDQKTLKRIQMKDRLALDVRRIKGMQQGLLALAKQPDVLNKVLETRKPKNGLIIEKISVPLGTVGVVYESRPNVTIDLAGLSIKSGNGLVLKGGSEAYKTNSVLVKLIKKVLLQHGLSSDLVYLIKPQEDWQKALLNAYGLVDVLIPRGGAGLIKWVRQNSKIPVIETGAGVCHTFVDADCDIQQAVKIIINAKTQRPDVCNALDTLVADQKALEQLLPVLAAPLAEFRVEIFADLFSFNILKQYYPGELLHQAKPEHYGHEFLSLKMAIKTVQSFESGLEFVKQKTSGHSEAFLSRDKNHISRFLKEVDAAVVYVNASTRFTDGGEFGMGAEVGISTQKFHARGPMGLMALTSYKWIAIGKGQVRT